VLAALDSHGIEYALCGGLAMAVWSYPRTTVDIDLLIPAESLEPLTGVVAPLGYVSKARPMTFSSGAIEIRRVSKPDPEAGDVLMLDLLLVTSALTDVWESRVRVPWDRGTICVVSREGLIKLKTFRSSGIDLDDIARLKSGL
jgi:hypothetical protein